MAWKVHISLNSFDVFISLYPGGSGVRKWVYVTQGSKSRPLAGQKKIFVTSTRTLAVEITTLKDGTYPYAFLPKPFQQH